MLISYDKFVRFVYMLVNSHKNSFQLEFRIYARTSEKDSLSSNKAVLDIFYCAMWPMKGFSGIV